MKVGTDAMLLGAFAKANDQDSVLDIGAGTGVLSLMIAQKSYNLKITAIEKEEGAYRDLLFNLNESPFDSTFYPIQQDFLQWNSTVKFDVIISNPPFFKDSFTVEKMDKRAKARNENHLPFDLLFKKSKDLLANNGTFWLIFPSEQLNYIQQLMVENSFYKHQQINIHGKPGEQVRVILCLSNDEIEEPLFSDFTIRNSDGNYTKEYIELTKEYHAKKVVR